MFEEAVAVNLIANARLIRAIDPLLRAARGRAVFLTCDHGQNGAPFWGAAAASKAGLEALVLAYAAEVGFTGVRVNLVDPGPVDTALRYKAFPGEDAAGLRKPEDVADAIVALTAVGETRNGQRIALHNG
jgi:NAD(P)-dependent dehydrogenase (short-subunit alcohol dehydrogenase family)